MRVEASDLPAPPFTNEPIAPGRIPRLDTVEFTPLDPALLKIKALTMVALGGALVAGSVVLSIMIHALWLAVAGAAIVGCCVSFLLQRIGISHMGYAIRERDFSFRSGVIGRSVATVPFARVQHVSIESGPLERRLGLSTLQLRSAGAAVSVPGLKESLAQDLKGLVIARAGDLAEAEAEAARSA